MADHRCNLGCQRSYIQNKRNGSGFERAHKVQQKSWGTQEEMYEEVRDYGKVQRREESGQEKDGEYNMLASDPIREINSLFWT